MSSGFITESEVIEIRKRRQEEWEKVRKADDPKERPEEPYDNRSLYEKLQEQKQKKDLEYEEAHKLKNMIKGLDDDEIEFLDLVDRTKTEADRKKEQEEEQELRDYRNRVSILQEKSIDERLQAEIVVNKTKREKQPNSQQKLLKGVVIKKPENQKRKIDEVDNSEETNVKKQKNPENQKKKIDEVDNSDETNVKKQKKPENQKRKIDEIDNSEETNVKEQAIIDVDDKSTKNTQTPVAEEASNTGLKCVAILPGIGCYQDSSSDNDDSSDSDDEPSPCRQIDLLGRKIVIKQAESK
ncbi:PSME3-interacting protein isoform X1 [Diabrotica virgifera virgifera]|uniref:PSME3-interacting protein isoform X1 n=1 Tax=Diabrotica virgifera virgifera TaxID=50390 RepID=A0A6P7FTL6_DIAVI|nr:PSME3-interacting protein isoform X1 [Diabrotica virgifera virgifera]